MTVCAYGFQSEFYKKSDCVLSIKPSSYSRKSWSKLSGTFTATAETMTLYLPQHDETEWFADDITVVKVQATSAAATTAAAATTTAAAVTTAAVASQTLPITFPCGHNWPTKKDTETECKTESGQKDSLKVPPHCMKCY